MKTKLITAGLGLCCGMALAQTSPVDKTAGQMSWKGLLVAAGCDSGGGTDSTNGNSVMTGPDLNGSKGSGMNGTSNDMSGTSATAVNQAPAGDQNFPKSTASAASESSGSMNTAVPAKNDAGPDDMEQARTVARHLGPGCHIGANTASFALRLSDGTLMSFDAASNAKIADQLHARVSGNVAKIFRAVIKGTASGNTISVDSMGL
jgi:hypothetical protein